MHQPAFIKSSKISPKRLTASILVVLLAIFYVHIQSVYGVQLPQRSLTIGDSRTNVTTTYKLGFDIPNNETLGSIKLQICSNDPLVNDSCTVPAGFNISSATLTSQSGATGFIILTTQTNSNTIVLSRVPASSGNVFVSYTLSGVVNPSSIGTYYGRVQTYPSIDASGSPNDFGGLAFSITNAVQITATVSPYLLFCVAISIPSFDCSSASGNYINFGNFSSSSTSSAQSQMLTASNAANGFAVSADGPTMTSGNNEISAMNFDDVSRPGVGQFGLNLVANHTPTIGSNPTGPGVASPQPAYNQADFFKYSSGDVIASASQPSDYREFTVSYIVNVSSAQPSGVYETSLTYICLANF